MSIIGRLALGSVKNLSVPVILLGAGWIGGAKYGAPAIYIDTIDSGVSWASSQIPWTAPPAQSENKPPTDEEHESSNTTPETESLPPENDDIKIAGTKTQAPATTLHVNEAAVGLCDTAISNAPDTGANGAIAKAGATLPINGVELLKAPVTKACFSSGFGYRGYSPHRGADYFSDEGGSVLAAGDGIIIEAEYRNDYGNTIVVDHDSGIYTRYAHLAGFEPNVKIGARVARGQSLGPIGRTGSAGAAHLHYEVRTGDYTNPKKYWGLTPVDPLSGRTF
ncbi:MAG: M23 family metallopeptidase [Marinicaulis sp.]|nr:M23 family metallopeptidase [Marinicaulis sp.]NNE42052.1 M23 family metallopeptidase [Marinicaulis sp.]NNL87844.1 M23 family metallopeptidase [Marinicaulis sp.]